MPALPHPRFVLFLSVFAVSGLALVGLVHWHVALVASFDLAALAFLAAMAPLWNGGDAARMRRSAEREDGGRVFRLAVAGVVVAVILFALGMVVAGKSDLGPVDLVLVLVTLVLAWAFVNIVFALHYAHRYYAPAADGGDSGGLAFPDTAEPGLTDFCYFAFVLGMTFQVSDVAVATPYLRKVAMIHGMLAFFYNLGVLALVINVLAGIIG